MAVATVWRSVLFVHVVAAALEKRLMARRGIGGHGTEGVGRDVIDNYYEGLNAATEWIHDYF